jgi:Uma2 family endonuclease
MSAANQLPPAMSVTEFLAWSPPDGDRWELVDGTPRAMAPSSPRHGAIQAEAARQIGNRLAACRTRVFGRFRVSIFASRSHR